MRDTNAWCEDAVSALADSPTFTAQFPRLKSRRLMTRQARRKARLLCQVEMGLYYLHSTSPTDPAIAVADVLRGYPRACDSAEDRQRIKVLRLLLQYRKGAQWRRTLKEYQQLDRRHRMFDVPSVEQPAIVQAFQDLPDRQNLYTAALGFVPRHRQRLTTIAGAGTWYYRVRGEVRKLVLPDEVQAWRREADNARAQRIGETQDSPKAKHHPDSLPLESIVATRDASLPAESIAWAELEATAAYLDSCLPPSGRYYQRAVADMKLLAYDPVRRQFRPVERIEFEELRHVGGRVGVGKTTIIKLMAAALARRQNPRRSVIVVGDSATAVQIATEFHHFWDIPTVPILGRSERQEQLKKLASLLTKEPHQPVPSFLKGAAHPAADWFRTECPLLAFMEGEPIAYGEEPCTKLYDDDPDKEQSRVPDDDDELVPPDSVSDEEEGNKEEDKPKRPRAHMCPAYHWCPQHRIGREMREALVWVTTPAALVHTSAPVDLVGTPMRTAELVFRSANVVFVDEADRVLAEMDEIFAPSEVMVGTDERGFLQRLGARIGQIDRSSPAVLQNGLVVSWLTAGRTALTASTRMYNRLLNDVKLRMWVGDDPFTGRALLTRLARELADPDAGDRPEPVEANQPGLSQLRKKLGEETADPGARAQLIRQWRDSALRAFHAFCDDPYGETHTTDLTVMADHCVSRLDDEELRREAVRWVRRWMTDQKVPLEKRDVMELAAKLDFAVLVTALGDRLVRVLNDWSNVREILDLPVSGEELVYRPPADYLPVIPEGPLGNIVGFQYLSSKQPGTLRFFRYAGVGRALLLDFPNLWKFGNDHSGPHTLLFSATSWAPGSPTYHVSRPPDWILVPANGDGALRQSEFRFAPVRTRAGTPIAISGLPADKRQSALIEAMDWILAPRAQGGSSTLDALLGDIESRAKKEEAEGSQSPYWSDRQRVLIPVGNFEESYAIADHYRSMFRWIPDRGEHFIASLVRNGDEGRRSGVPRSRIADVCHTPTGVLIGPAKSLERGHNAMNRSGRIAGFGALLMPIRILPVPEDWLEVVRTLNAMAMSWYQNPGKYAGGHPTWHQHGAILHRKAYNRLYTLLQSWVPFFQLNRAARRRVYWTMLVLYVQLIGRLVRGGVPASVWFLDAKFAPRSAEGEKDTPVTSLLLGLRWILQPYMEQLRGRHISARDRALAQELYGWFYDSLTNMRGMNND